MNSPSQDPLGRHGDGHPVVWLYGWGNSVRSEGSPRSPSQAVPFHPDPGGAGGCAGCPEPEPRVWTMPTHTFHIPSPQGSDPHHAHHGHCCTIGSATALPRLDWTGSAGSATKVCFVVIKYAVVLEKHPLDREMPPLTDI